MKKNKKVTFKTIIWSLNALLFVAVVVLGIEQGTKGADISNIERMIEEESVAKRDIAEKIFEIDAVKYDENNTLGFVKPSNIMYFDAEAQTAKLPVR